MDWNDPELRRYPEIDPADQRLRAAAERIHANESLHRHDPAGSTCVYCTLNAARALSARDVDPRFEAYDNSRDLEAHILDAHRHDLTTFIAREVRTLAWLRERHAELHRDGQMRFAHQHDEVDLPPLVDPPLSAATLGLGTAGQR
jgi:hypothetical protein